MVIRLFFEHTNRTDSKLLFAFCGEKLSNTQGRAIVDSLCGYDIPLSRKMFFSDNFNMEPNL